MLYLFWQQRRSERFPSRFFPDARGMIFTVCRLDTMVSRMKTVLSQEEASGGGKGALIYGKTGGRLHEGCPFAS